MWRGAASERALSVLIRPPTHHNGTIQWLVPNVHYVWIAASFVGELNFAFLTVKKKKKNWAKSKRLVEILWVWVGSWV